jgi:hypothetical protein
VTQHTVSSRARLAWLIGVVSAACGARTSVLGDEEQLLVPDASVDAAPPKEAGHDAPPPDAAPDVRDAAPDTACDACVRMLVHDDQGFWEMHAPEGTLQQLGPAPDLFMGDIALTPDKKTLWGAGSAGLARIDMTTWKVVGSIPAPEMNALEVGPDGTFYGAEWDTIYMVTPTGTSSTLATFPGGLHSSGDVAFAAGHLYATAFAASGDALVEVDVPGRSARVVGPTQSRCIFGLVGADPAPLLYGVTCNGELVDINPATGDTHVLAKRQTGFLGATRLADPPH